VVCGILVDIGISINPAPDKDKQMLGLSLNNSNICNLDTFLKAKSFYLSRLSGISVPKQQITGTIGKIGIGASKDVA